MIRRKRTTMSMLTRRTISHRDIRPRDAGFLGQPHHTKVYSISQCYSVTYRSSIRSVLFSNTLPLLCLSCASPCTISIRPCFYSCFFDHPHVPVCVCVCVNKVTRSSLLLLYIQMNTILQDNFLIQNIFVEPEIWPKWRHQPFRKGEPVGGKNGDLKEL